MSNLSEFLLARITEDDAVARTATAGPWQSKSHDVQLVAVRDDPGYEGLGLHTAVARTHMTTGKAQQEWANAQHIARHDPARVLAECEAKRRLIALGEKDSYWEDVLRLLALPYADHPDYEESWRP